jgi:DEAD/DEAH box helicase domain-containing protein
MVYNVPGNLPHPGTRMDFATFLHELKQSSGYRGQIVQHACDPARAARYGTLRPGLTPAGQAALATRGIQRLYTHQAKALREVRKGRDVLMATGTASGKSLVHQLAILELLERDPNARVIALYPTKALAQDQLFALQPLLGALGQPEGMAGCYDGDTPATLRRKLRDQGRVILTNPDMVHAGLLPQHTRWAGFLENLKLIIVDEAHTYSGLFGANVANLLRRLARVQTHYETRPQFLLSSATLANPEELGRLLTGREMTVVDDDGSPAGPRHWVFWNPPVIYGKRFRSRRSANAEACDLMSELVRRGLPTIAFSKARITAELIYRYVCENLERTAPELVSKVMPYRGGYLPEERREIERRLFEGELLGVSCTRALELGIDIGGLDASLIVGYPGTLSSFFQQAGRAGRRDRESLAVLIGLDTSINQYVMEHPEYVFDRPLEQAVLDCDNPHLVAGHLRCATHELPVAETELPGFGAAAPEALAVLQDLRKVRRQDSRWYHASAETPQFELSLRGYSEAEVIIQDRDTRKAIGHLNLYDAPSLVHPGAIYLHYGDTFLVDELNFEKRVATVHPVEVDYYTQPWGGTDVHHIDRTLRRKPFGAGEACFGEVTAYFATELFERIQFYRLEPFAREAISPPLPVLQLETMAFWLCPPDDLLRTVTAAGLDAHAGLRAIAYGLRMFMPLLMTCDTLDLSHSVGCTNAPWQTLFVYERYPLGIGFTERAYERLGTLLPALAERIRACECRNGCPCCVGKPLRGVASWNVERGEGSIPAKQAALMILDGLLVGPLDASDETSLGQPDAEARQLLQQSLRRRLERQGYPDIFHPITPHPPNGYPSPEPAAVLSDTDVARRAMRRRQFERGEIAQAWQEGRHEAARAAEASEVAIEKEVAPAPTPGAPSAVRVVGDALAAQALRRRKQPPSADTADHSRRDP